MPDGVRIADYPGESNFRTGSVGLATKPSTTLASGRSTWDRFWE